MLKDYDIVEHGVIKQVNITNKLAYDVTYSEVFNTPRYKNNSMSYLRYGYLIGSLGFTPESILDVGYGNGSFLKVCEESGVPECCGFDITEYPVPDGCTKVYSMFDRSYDVVTFYDSLEHFDDIGIIHQLDTQYICISVPWCHNFSDEWFSEWKHRRPGEHLWHFDPDSLVKFMRNYDFDVINMCNVEDVIRKSEFKYPNILTATFSRI